MCINSKCKNLLPQDVIYTFMSQFGDESSEQMQLQGSMKVKDQWGGWCYHKLKNIPCFYKEKKKHCQKIRNDDQKGFKPITGAKTQSYETESRTANPLILSFSTPWFICKIFLSDPSLTNGLLESVGDCADLLNGDLQRISKRQGNQSYGNKKKIN